MKKPTPMEQLQAQEAALKARMAEDQKRLARVAKQRRSLEEKARREQWSVVGQLVEKMGLPMDPRDLGPILRAAAGLALRPGVDAPVGASNGGLCVPPLSAPENQHPLYTHAGMKWAESRDHFPTKAD